MYTVKEIKEAILNCTSVRDLIRTLIVVNYLSRSGDFNEDQKYKIEVAATVKRRTFQIGR